MSVEYASAPRAAFASTPPDAKTPAAASVHPWECSHSTWVELYRYFAFLQTDLQGDAVTADTEEAPRTLPDPATGRATTKGYMPPEKFDVAKHGATHYTVTPPAGSEVVFQCKSCTHTVAVKLDDGQVAKLAEKYASGELLTPHFSQLTLKELLGTEPTPGTVTLPAPTIPEWVDEQRTMIRRIAAGLPPTEEPA